MKKNISKKFLLLLLLLILAILILLLIAVSIISEKSKLASLETQQAVAAESEDIILTLTAQDFVSDITVGWNLGNSFDSCVSNGRNDGTRTPEYYETAWGNPVTTPELIDLVSSLGFNTIRIPVTWFYNTYDKDGHLYIREEWLARVAEVVDYAYANNMYVIINSHHDTDMFWADMTDIEQVAQNATDIWSQIAEYFKDYDSNLIFEGFNELNTKDNSWIYTDKASQATNILNQVFVDTVRESGGNNASRILICNTYLSDTIPEVLNSFVLPTDTIDDRLIIEVHSYDSSYNQQINELFIDLSEFSKEQNAPVIIGEFGSTDSFVPAEFRSKHAGNYVACANQYGIKCFWWDDGLTYKLIDREKNKVVVSDVLESLMNPVAYQTDILTTFYFQDINDYTYGTIHSENGTITDSSQGTLTLTPNRTGIRVMQGLGYRITLSTTDDADGLRIGGIAFYDSSQAFISYVSVNQETVYDVTAPANAAYMKVSFYNPWGYRSLAEYTKYLNKYDLSLIISEYEKE